MESDYYSEIFRFINSLFDDYINRNEITEFEANVARSQWDFVKKALNAFRNNQEYEPFSFSLSCRTAHAMEYLSISLGEVAIKVSQGTAVYSSDTGSDPSTLWEYTLWNNGEDDGSLLLDWRTVWKLIDSGWTIHFETPWNFTDACINSELIGEYKYAKEKMELESALTSSYENLMYRLAQPIVKRLVGKVRRQLQSYTRSRGMMLSEENSNLRNVWDEFCVQCQGVQSYFYGAYFSCLNTIINDIVKQCSEDELTILWTQSNEYELVKDNIDAPREGDILADFSKEEAVCEYLLSEVEFEATNYSSKRIEDYLYG